MFLFSFLDYDFYFKNYSSEQYPGNSILDCRGNMSIEAAKLLNCTNLNYKDRYGFYRDYNLVQIKLHWFWKISYIFDELIYTKNIENLNVLLLEEDFFVFPDALHVLKILKNKVSNKSVEIISLSDTYIDQTKPDFYNSSNYYSKCINHLCTSAIVFTRYLWKLLRSNANQFCERDDYNWDW